MLDFEGRGSNHAAANQRIESTFQVRQKQRAGGIEKVKGDRYAKTEKVVIYFLIRPSISWILSYSHGKKSRSVPNTSSCKDITKVPS